MPEAIVDVNTFTDPVTTPVDADSRNAASVKDPVQKLANRTRWLANLIGGVAGSGEWVYPSARARKTMINLLDGREMRDTSGATPEWRFAPDPTTATAWTSLVDTGRVVFPLNNMLRDGEVITDIEVALKPGAARSGANRVQVSLYYELSDFATIGNNPATPQLVGGASKPDDTTANKQIVSLASVLGAGHTVVRAAASSQRAYFLLVQAGNTGASAADLIYGARLSRNDPGPRNF